MIIVLLCDVIAVLLPIYIITVMQTDDKALSRFPCDCITASITPFV